MSITTHNWSDGQLLLLSHSDDEIDLEFTLIPEVFSFNKQDAIAIAKHFNVDRESLVEGIKELIATTRNKDAEVFSANDLQKLITKEE
jgi:hypothetical protein